MARTLSRFGPWGGRGSIATASAFALGWALASAAPAHAFRIELKDVAPDRIERQRAEAIGQIPFPGTPNIAQFDQRLKDKGLAMGAAMFIRVFKAESELEVWLRKGDRFELFATYPICHWSGTLGPKISEGDKQAPEGVYTVTWKQLHMVGRHPRSLNLGFPNALDKQFQRTGSYILIHGGCGSVGCYAMTNPVIEEVFSLAQAAIKGGQDAIHVHAFPFRLTESKLQAYALHEWYDYWRNLKDIHDRFDATRRVPKVTVCEGRYWLDPDDGEVASQPPLAVCGASLEVASLKNPMASASSQTASSGPQPRSLAQGQQQSPLPLQRLSGQPARSWVPPVARAMPPALPEPSSNQAGLPVNRPAALGQPSSQRASRTATAATTEVVPFGVAPSSGTVPPIRRIAPPSGLGGPGAGALQAQRLTAPTAPEALSVPCQRSLPSCRKWIAQQQVTIRRVAQSGGAAKAAPQPTRR